MRRTILTFACLAAVLAAGAPAFAQRTTGTIVGTVTDDTGAVLPGVTVVLRGAAIMGTQDNVTNDQGFYRFAALPPGSYTLTFSLASFSTLNREGIRVSVGGTIEENVSLKLGQTRGEEITVVGEGAVVDTQTNQVSTNYDKDWVRNAPIPRFTFFDLINAAPGVNQSAAGDSRSTSLGSGTSDNSYQLDGTDFTAPLTGAAWPWPNTDAIEEIEVLSLGAPAEYGNLQGAVFNVVTRQGSNVFHGDANFYYQNDALTGRNTTDAQDEGLPYHRDKYHDFSAQVSGPIVKDKLWFFGSYQYQRNYESYVGADPAFPARSEADRVFGKLNWQITPQNKLMLAYHDDYYRIPFAASAVEAPSTIKVEHGRNPSPNLTYTGVISDKTYVEARVSGFYGEDHADPLEESEPRVKPRFLDVDSGEITGGIYSWYDGDIWKTAASAKVSHFADSFLGGSHDFKFGVQFNDGGHDYVTGYNDYIYTGGGEVLYGYTQLPFHQAGKVRSVGVFFDDTFRVNNRLSFNLGARYDRSQASFGSYAELDRAGGETGVFSPADDDLFTWNTWSPRVGVNLKLTADGKTVLKAHYGRYYRGVVTGEFDDVAPSVSPRYLFSGTYDAAGNPEGLELVSDNTSLRVDPGFASPYTDQFIVGFERELARNLGLSLNYVHKRGERYGGWQYQGETVPAVYSDTKGADASGADIPVLIAVDPGSATRLLTNPDGMFMRFNGLTVQLTKRMSDNWQAVASLVVSKSTGRLGSSNRGPLDEQNSVARNFGQNPNDFINTDGRLLADRPVTAKLQFVYQLPAGFLIGANYTYQQGRPWARLVRPDRDEDIDLGLPTTFLAEKLDGSRRVKSWNTLDLRVQKEFSLSKDAAVAVFADALNLTNNDAYDGIQDRVGTSDAFGLPSDFILPRRVMLGAKFRF
jgi:hypothetical protein